MSKVWHKCIYPQEKIFIAIVAAWIWNLSNEYFYNAIEILNYFHGISHLYNIAKTVFGENEIEVIEVWINENEIFLFIGCTSR